jgi:septal ring factor EnvC (AmiA/AmiB activator)
VIQELERQAQELQSLISSLPSERESASGQVSGFQALKGRLPVPVVGKIDTQGHRKFRGIFLEAPLGEIVRAVHRGRVVYADWFKGYGNLLIIDHGDKFHTVVGHAFELLRGKGDWVETGEPVAKVGSTGSLGMPSLYFEIRKNGVPLDPLEWFSRAGRLALKQGK